MPASDTWKIIIGVIKAKTNTKFVEVKRALAQATRRLVGLSPACKTELSPSSSASSASGSSMTADHLIDARQIDAYLKCAYGKILSSPMVKIPKPILTKWMIDDVEFARQRLAGQHPCLIARWKDPLQQLPFTLPSDTPESVAQAIAAANKRNQLFICDYEALDLSRDMIKEGAFLSAPIALFEVDSVSKQLMPLGIMFRKQREVPLFITPRDKPILWFLAKLHVQVADNHYQQFYHHLPFCHMIAEPVALAIKYTLPDSHPIGRLLRPHFRGTFEINWLARVLLISKGGIIDEVMASGRVGAMALSAKAFNNWNFKARALNTDLVNRGVDDRKVGNSILLTDLLIELTTLKCSYFHTIRIVTVV